MTQYIINAPLHIIMGNKRVKNKKTGVYEYKPNNFALNLNVYRNAHFTILNKSKIRFKEIIGYAVSQLPVMQKVELTYTVYLPSKRKTDINNIVSVVDKYFSDALVELGRLPDDNYEHLATIISTFGGISTDNPRVEITIKDISHTVGMPNNLLALIS